MPRKPISKKRMRILKSTLINSLSIIEGQGEWREIKQAVPHMNIDNLNDNRLHQEGLASSIAKLTYLILRKQGLTSPWLPIIDQPIHDGLHPLAYLKIVQME